MITTILDTEAIAVRIVELLREGVSMGEPVNYTVPEVAARLRVTDNTVRRLVREGKLSRVDGLAGVVIITRAEVERFERGNT